MDAKKVQEVIDVYRAKLEELGAKPIDYTHTEFVYLGEEKLGHCLGMLPQMEQFIKDNEMDKVFRWLGFIQGVLWVEGIYTLEEMRSHNRS
jgi:hypothetical protein